MTQQPRQIERPDAPPVETEAETGAEKETEADTGNVVPLRVAGLPGADRRILRKRLSRPLKAAEKPAPESRTMAR